MNKDSLFVGMCDCPVGKGFELDQRICEFPRRSEHCADIYHWAEWEKAKGNLRTPEPVLVQVEQAQFRHYDALKENGALFRLFAETAPTPEGCLAFANQYGRLGIERYEADEVEPTRPVERIAAWRGRIVWLRHLVELWDLIRTKDIDGLSRLVRWHERGVDFVSLPPECPFLSIGLDEASHLFKKSPTSLTMDLESLPGADLVVCAGDSVSASSAFLHFALMLDLHSGFGMAQAQQLLGVGYLIQTVSKWRLRIQSKTLWGAILLQFLLAIDGERDFQRCAVCRRWFELSPGVNRSDRLTCSASCRVQRARQRRERALELHAQGNGVREIAKEIGSKLENVKRWIRDHNQKE